MYFSNYDDNPRPTLTHVWVPRCLQFRNLNLPYISWDILFD